ncbi:MAG: TIGR03643 family protein [uncultured Sulfurovum sp.]|uniref:TIGR03643 family protein n=1 Tax=uncultured Sulfurovum sp. TaxID=269237 RepID=A0A6S6TQP2_9BACT|nr:MAG: TIGR03643 family protein [uncultured Sulfurovum sp.]
MVKKWQIVIFLNEQKKYTNHLRFTVRYNMIKLEFNEPHITNDKALVSEEDTAKSKTKQPLIKKPIKPLINKDTLNDGDYNRIVEMAWQDRTHFDIIHTQYGLSENEIKKLMRKLLSPSSFKRWRKRVQGRKTKHEKLCAHKPTRFQGPW